MVRLRFALLLGGLVAACAGGAPAAAGPRTPLTVWVFDERVTFDAEDRPLANVRVAFDPASGARVVKTTEPDGHVTFEGDFSRGGASVTVLSPEHLFVTMLEASPETARARPNTIGKPEGDLVVFAPRLDAVTQGLTLELRGTIIGKQDPDHVVSLAASALGRLGSTAALEKTYALRVPRDRPFFLLGHETKTLLDRDGAIVSNDLVKSFRLELPARSGDELLELDLQKLPSLPSRRIRVRVETGAFGDATRAVASVASVDSGLTVGLFGGSTPAEAGFDVSISMVDTDIASERPFSQAALIAPDGSRSTRMELGVVADGFVFRGFPSPPAVAAPDASRALADPIPLDGFPAGADLAASLYAAGQVIWVLYGPPGGPRARSFTIPPQSEITFPAEIQLFALSLTARMDRVPLPPHGELYLRSATFRDVPLRKR